jgi:hypothetical protein
VGRARHSFALSIALAAALCAQPKLTLALHQFEDGPPLADNYEFVPGEPAHFTCRFAAFEIQKKDEERSVNLAWRMRVTDPAGVLIEKEKSGRIADKLLPQDKNWTPKFLETFVVPAFAPSGIYRVEVKVKDEVSGKESAGELPFHVRGHEVDTSPTLVTRNFLFLQAENDRTGMRTPVYHPGEMLWAKFDITGYKLGPNNHVEVDYGLAVLNAAGEQLFAQPDAATESKESFYPQHYVPGMLSLSLSAGVVKGSYILLVTVRDKVGGQSWETRQNFEVK